MKSRGFTLVEILVVIGIVAALAAILFPVFSVARAKSRQTTCVSNLRQIGIAYALYAQDFDDRFALGADPSDLYTSGWSGDPKAGFVRSLKLLPEVLLPYTKSKQVWRCPADTGFDWIGPDEELLLPTHPSSFAVYGMSYYCRTSLVMNEKLYSGLTGTLDGKTVGASQIGFLFDGSGTWHGEKKEGRRYNALFVDGHAKSTTRSEFEAVWRISL